ncbi:MAG: hypothetical protein PHC51_02625, partial [bacterium]|nr:hypothetical protein [bacterium]
MFFELIHATISKSSTPVPLFFFMRLSGIWQTRSAMEGWPLRSAEITADNKSRFNRYLISIMCLLKLCFSAYIISISGLHVTMVAGLLGGLAGGLWRRWPGACLRWPAQRVAVLAA